MIEVLIQRNPEALDLPLPTYATEGSAGVDLYAVLDAPLVIAPGDRVRVSTGIRVGLPQGYEGQIRPRSGLAWRFGLTLLNAPGTIDADFTGTIQVILINLGQEPAQLERGDRIAQLVVAPVVRVCWAHTEALPVTQRGESGFGSSGK